MRGSRNFSGGGWVVPRDNRVCRGVGGLGGGEGGVSGLISVILLYELYLKKWIFFQKGGGVVGEGIEIPRPPSRCA